MSRNRAAALDRVPERRVGHHPKAAASLCAVIRQLVSRLGRTIISDSPIGQVTDSRRLLSIRIAETQPMIDIDHLSQNSTAPRAERESVD